MAVARRYEIEALSAEAAGRQRGAIGNYTLAYGYYRAARYPCMNSPSKREAYRKSQEMHMASARDLDPPLERVQMPFTGRPGEGESCIGLLRVPRSTQPLPVALAWGGIDAFKEERRIEPFLARGFATLCIDMPGVGDAPLTGSEDAERMWDAVFDWIAAEPRLEADQVVLWGCSTGGYWSAKLAHTHRQRVTGAVEHGGAIHYAYQPEWILASQHGEYPFELVETLASAFGRSTFDEWLEYAPKLSLLDQGILDQPCAPLLCINGLHDSVFPVADQYLLLEHGRPKSIRLYDTGHMGYTARTMTDILAWIDQTLERGSA
jgi:hypothetical protein